MSWIASPKIIELVNKKLSKPPKREKQSRLPKPPKNYNQSKSIPGVYPAIFERASEL